MTFPTQIQPQTINQVLAFALNTDKDMGRLALALYDIVGFGLGKAFPNAAFLSGSPAVEATAMAELLKDEEVSFSPELITQLKEAEKDPAQMGPVVNAVVMTLLPVLIRAILKRLQKQN